MSESLHKISPTNCQMSASDFASSSTGMSLNCCLKTKLDEKPKRSHLLGVD